MSVGHRGQSMEITVRIAEAPPIFTQALGSLVPNKVQIREFMPASDGKAQPRAYVLVTGRVNGPMDTRSLKYKLYGDMHASPIMPDWLRDLVIDALALQKGSVEALLDITTDRR